MLVMFNILKLDEVDVVIIMLKFLMGWYDWSFFNFKVVIYIIQVDYESEEQLMLEVVKNLVNNDLVDVMFNCYLVWQFDLNVKIGCDEL